MELAADLFGSAPQQQQGTWCDDRPGVDGGVFHHGGHRIPGSRSMRHLIEAAQREIVSASRLCNRVVLAPTLRCVVTLVFVCRL